MQNKGYFDVAKSKQIVNLAIYIPKLMKFKTLISKCIGCIKKKKPRIAEGFLNAIHKYIIFLIHIILTMLKTAINKGRLSVISIYNVHMIASSQINIML